MKTIDDGAIEKKVQMKRKRKSISPNNHQSEIDLNRLRQFFDFFENYDVRFWLIDAFPRKKGGDRGAPVLAHFENFNPQIAVYGARRATSYINRVHRFMLSCGKMADIHTRESPEIGLYHRTIMLDDLDFNSLEALNKDYPGPLAAIETSPENYQAILIAPRFPMDDTPTKFRGLLRPEVLEIQRGLARKYGGDTGAIAAGQFHRFSESPNYKKVCLNGEKPFYSKTTILRQQIGTAEGAVEFLKNAMKTELSGNAIHVINHVKSEQTPGPTQKPINTPIGRDTSSSGEAFRYALRCLRNLVPPARVTTEVQSRWGSGRSPDWAERTVHNAQHLLGMKPQRYISQKPTSNCPAGKSSSS